MHIWWLCGKLNFRSIFHICHKPATISCSPHIHQPFEHWALSTITIIIIVKNNNTHNNNKYQKNNDGQYFMAMELLVMVLFSHHRDHDHDLHHHHHHHRALLLPVHFCEPVCGKNPLHLLPLNLSIERTKQIYFHISVFSIFLLQFLLTFSGQRKYIFDFCISQFFSIYLIYSILQRANKKIYFSFLISKFLSKLFQ